MEFGGYSWQKAGKIWWDTLLSGVLDPDCTFTDFAKATIVTAKKSFDEEAAAVVMEAWKSVGVITKKDAGWMDRVMQACKPL